MLRVGLTGGIACGKSHVRRRLAAAGIAVLDLDAVARGLLAPGTPAHHEVAEAFGGHVLAPGGELDREALAAIVFADAAARARLEAIVHPRVRSEEQRRTRELEAAGNAIVVTEAALLIEAGAHLRFDRLVVVHCAPALQLARLRARNGLAEHAALARIESQMPLAEKRAFAHFEVETSGTPVETDSRVDLLATELRAAAARPSTAAVPFGRLLGIAATGPPLGPRGLSGVVLLQTIARDGGLEMASLASRLQPPARGAWYRAAGNAPPGAPAAALTPALVAWALARGRDSEYLAAAAASVARLTHDDAAQRSSACLEALLLHQVAVDAEWPRDPDALAARLLPLAARWGGAPIAEAAPAAWRGLAFRAAVGDADAAQPDPVLAAALSAATSGRL